MFLKTNGQSQKVGGEIFLHLSKSVFDEKLYDRSFSEGEPIQFEC